MNGKVKLSRRQVVQGAAAASVLLPACGKAPVAADPPRIDAQAFDHATRTAFSAGAVPKSANAFEATTQVVEVERESARIVATFGKQGPTVLRIWRDVEGNADQIEWVGDVAVEPPDPAANTATVFLDVGALAPATRYRYGFFNEAFSEVYGQGAFTTAYPDGWREPLTVAATACTSFSFMPYRSLEVAARQDPQLFLHLGDILYNDAAKGMLGYAANWKRTLSDPGYRAILEQCGWYSTWDDHEITNNFDPETIDPSRAEIAKRAYYMFTGTKDRGGRIWRSHRWGDTAEFFVLDCRSERKPSTRETDAEQYISEAQLAWVLDGLKNSTAHFKVVLNSVPITWFEHPLWLAREDRWQGYALQRERFLGGIVAAGIQNVVFLTGDFHLGMVSRVNRTGPYAGMWEIMCGPGANAGNPIGALALQPESDPKLRDQLFPKDYIPYAADRFAATLLTFEPKQNRIRVRFLDHDTGEARFDQYLVGPNVQPI